VSRFFGRPKGQRVNSAGETLVDPADKMLIAQMREAGEKLSSQTRETTHYLTFDSQGAARQAAKLAAAQGFVAEVAAPRDGVDNWAVHAIHTILVGEDTISSARRVLAEIAEQTGGVYDGWDTYSDAAIAKIGHN
jgi:regulator of RNase E activity RraB